jgi:CBS domain-containing protein
VKIEDIMTRDVRACLPDDTLATAAQIMWENDCGSVPVTDPDGRVIGIITDRDLAMAAHLQGVALRASRVSSAMARDVKCCTPRDTPATVQALMQQHKIRRVPVVDEHKHLLGIVSLGDLAYAMAAEQTLGRRRHDVDGRRAHAGARERAARPALGSPRRAHVKRSSA